jgi:fucose 4-O-acetylase-like acetyltransferase
MVIYSSTGMLQPTQIMKYPPTIYFISYALFVSYLLMSLFKKIDLKRNGAVEFISKSSLWIYLWHILFLTVIPLVMGELDWPAYYIIVLACAISVTFIQNRIVDFLENRNINSTVLKIFRG